MWMDNMIISNNQINTIKEKYNNLHIHDIAREALINNDIDTIKKLIRISNLPITWSALQSYITSNTYKYMTLVIDDIEPKIEEKFNERTLHRRLEEIIDIDIYTCINCLLQGGRIDLLNLYIDYLNSNKDLFIEYKNIMIDMNSGLFNTSLYPRESIEWLINNNINSKFYTSIINDDLSIDHISHLKSMNMTISNFLYIVINMDSYNIYMKYINTFKNIELMDHMYSVLRGRILGAILSEFEFCNKMIEYLRLTLAKGKPYPSCYNMASIYLSDLVKFPNQELRLYLLSICMEHGYIDLIDKYIDNTIYISVLARCIDIHPNTIEYLQYGNHNMDISLLTFYILNQTNGSPPISWTKILIEAIKGNNIILVNSIITFHISEIDDEIISIIYQIYMSQEMKNMIKSHIPM